MAGQQLELLADHGTLRLAARVPEMEPLSKTLTASLLTKEIGDPDEVKRTVVRSDFEGRSRAVTEYSYEDGSVRFVNQNISYNYGSGGADKNNPATWGTYNKLGARADGQPLGDF